MEISQRWFLLIVFVVLSYILVLLGPILSPFIIAALLAYLTDPATDKLETLGFSRTNAVLVVFAVITCVFLLTLLLLLPKFAYQIGILLKQIPVAISLVEENVIPFLKSHFGLDPLDFNFDLIKSLIKENARETGNIVNNVLKSMASSGLAFAAWLANAVLIPVVFFYLLRDWDIMIAKIHLLLPRQLEKKTSVLACECDEVLGAFIKGQLMVMMALGTIYSIGLWLVGLDLALILGMLAGLASIVPYMGFIVGIIAAVIAAMIQFNDPTILIWVGLVFVVGQALEGMILTPLMVGDKIGLHPVAVIFSIMAGGQLFGFVGVLIALPVAAVIMVFLRHIHDGYKGSSLYESAEHTASKKVDDAVINIDEEVDVSSKVKHDETSA